MKKLFMFLFFHVCLFSLSCGYTTKSTLSSDLKTVHVEPFKNRIKYGTESSRNIYFPLLEVDIRNAVIDRFQFDGNLRIAEADLADLVLKGELIGYERGALRFTDSDDVEEYRIHIIVSLELWITRTGEMMWSESSFVGEATYFVSGPLTTSEESAVDEAVIDIGRRIVERTIENW